MKRRRYLPNAVRSQEIRDIDYLFFSIPTGKRKRIHLIDKKDNYLLLRQKHSKIRKVRYPLSTGVLAFFDELANKAYMLKRRQLQDHTIPIITTKLEAPFECRATRSGMVKIVPLPK